MDFIHSVGTLIWFRCCKADRVGTNIWPFERLAVDWGEIGQVPFENPFKSRGVGGRWRAEFGGRGRNFKKGVE